MGRPMLIPSPWRDLAGLAGSVAAAAALLGVSERTLRLYARGEGTPRTPARKSIEREFCLQGLPLPVWGRRKRGISPEPEETAC